MFAHAGLGETSAAPDLDGLVGDVVGGAGHAHFEEADGAGEVLGLEVVGHVAHLVGDGFEPGLVGFDEGDHFGDSKGGGGRRKWCFLFSTCNPGMNPFWFW